MPTINKAKRFQQIFGADTPTERMQLIAELEKEVLNPFVSVRLRPAQVRLLAEYLLLLPWTELRMLCLYYAMGYSFAKVEKILGITGCRGRILYCKDRLTQCLGLPRPAAERCWRAAAVMAMDRYAELS